MLGKFITRALFTSALFSSIGFAATIQPQQSHIVVAPKCLLNEVNYNTITFDKSLYLIEVNDEGIYQLIVAKEHQKKLCGGFMDVTPEWQSFNSKLQDAPKKAETFLKEYTSFSQPIAKKSTASYAIKHQAQVNQLIGQLNPTNMWANLTALTNFRDRFANSDYGVQAANWIKSQVEAMAASQGRTDVHAYTVATGFYKQPSVVVKIGDSTAPGVVIGGHMDTLSSFWKGVHLPGADDDGTGSVTVLETVRALLASGMHFKKPIYFIWYAAEEQGLVGSYYVVNEFKKKNIPVEAVIHFDMTGYAYKNDTTMWLIKDYTNAQLSSYIEQLINAYVKQPVKYTECGYACSDHASWTKGGIAAAMPAEAKFENTNPHLHSAQDTLDKISLSHMTDYLKLSAAFLVEMAEPV